MTSVVRYVQNTTTAANVNTNAGSTGTDYQLVVFDITTTAGITANANANILTWTGAGKIKSIASVLIKATNTQGVVGVGITLVTATNIIIDATGKVINLAVSNGGVGIPANATICLTLVIGNY
jgi:hypothetical protein